MTKTQKSIELAKLLGWKEIRWYRDDRYEGVDPRYNKMMPLERYAEDLNAIAEVEQSLTFEQFEKYSHMLERQAHLKFIATAEERTDALILTLSK